MAKMYWFLQACRVWGSQGARGAGCLTFAEQGNTGQFTRVCGAAWLSTCNRSLLHRVQPAPKEGGACTVIHSYNLYRTLESKVVSLFWH